MKVALELGYQYLWVDRYCIDQGDQQNKHIQIGMMDRIYAEADFAIIAAVGDAHYGLPGVGSDKSRRTQKSIQIGDVTLIEILNPSEHIQTSTWASRAWTLQEGCLSRRQVIFTNEGVAFLCKEFQFWESIDLLRSTPNDAALLGMQGTKQFRRLIPIIDPSSDDAMITLDRLLRDYSQRTLTFDEDALNAILGILNEFRVLHLRGMPVIARHTSLDLAYAMDLTWRNAGPGRERPGFPSWSWASWNNAKGFKEDGWTIHVCKVECYLSVGKWVDVASRARTGYGDLRTASPGKTIRITGKVFKPRVILENSVFRAIVPLYAQTNLYLTISVDAGESTLDALGDYIALVIERDKARPWPILLFLKPGDTSYRRIGVSYETELRRIPGALEVNEARPLWMQEARTRTIYVD
ncbi:hypothetical protein EKO04_004278 [Ascochyta lentis]|uniref:Heterokaryon incompatibility domain-containing protein n=1 Tax=Ascochyta lentis TaxID=205686 RepID=A0A8H7J952_9PLEO|nr:hypothetical protein EKO04_004278 [Ascochyta lentis]